LQKNIKPSARGEYEITVLTKCIWTRSFEGFNRGTAWLDTGTFNSLMQAGQFVQVIEEPQVENGCIEDCLATGFIQMRTSCISNL
jgi:glucose-1-phosphate thymidylyltransferase